MMIPLQNFIRRNKTALAGLAVFAACIFSLALIIGLSQTRRLKDIEPEVPLAFISMQSLLSMTLFADSDASTTVENYYRHEKEDPHMRRSGDDNSNKKNPLETVTNPGNSSSTQESTLLQLKKEDSLVGSHTRIPHSPLAADYITPTAFERMIADASRQCEHDRLCKPMLKIASPISIVDSSRKALIVLFSTWETREMVLNQLVIISHFGWKAWVVICSSTREQAWYETLGYACLLDTSPAMASFPHPQPTLAPNKKNGNTGPEELEVVEVKSAFRVRLLALLASQGISVMYCSPMLPWKISPRLLFEELRDRHATFAVSQEIASLPSNRKEASPNELRHFQQVKSTMAINNTSSTTSPPSSPLALLPVPEFIFLNGRVAFQILAQSYLPVNQRSIASTMSHGVATVLESYLHDIRKANNPGRLQAVSSIEFHNTFIISAVAGVDVDGTQEHLHAFGWSKEWEQSPKQHSWAWKMIDNYQAFVNTVMVERNSHPIQSVKHPSTKRYKRKQLEQFQKFLHSIYYNHISDTLKRDTIS